MNRGIYVARADKGVPRRAIDGEKTEAGFLRKRRRATAVAATGGAHAPGAEAHSAEDSENDDFDEKQPQLLKKQHAAARQKKVQAYLDGKLLDNEESGDVKDCLLYTSPSPRD